MALVREQLVPGNEELTLRDESGFSRCTLANKRFSFVSSALSSGPW